MDHFRNEYRRLVDSMVKELVAIAREVSRAEVQKAVLLRAAEEAKAAKAAKKTPKVSPRLARALERAEERRKLAAERRAAALAARAARSRRNPAHAEGPTSRREPVVAAPPSPPPLFVHKRSRDGSIQRLERSAQEQTARAESAPPPPA
jgi:hypothetical protein